MSSDLAEKTLVALAKALRVAKLEAIVIGNSASMLNGAPVTTQGPLIERHPAFPKRVNAGYLQPVSRAHVKLRVWERGAGETLSCGTGACAAVVAGIAQQRLDSPVRVQTRGGALTISWAGGDNAVIMKGPAETVFDGTLET